MRKITVLLPEELVDRAMAATGKGLTPTIREGLEAMAASQAYADFHQLRGTVKLTIDPDELRRD